MTLIIAILLLAMLGANWIFYILIFGAWCIHVRFHSLKKGDLFYKLNQIEGQIDRLRNELEVVRNYMRTRVGK